MKKKNKNTFTANPEDFLPHRSQMLLVDEILELNGEKAVTRTTVNSCWPMTYDLFTDSMILIEVVAQTAGIHNGWIRDNTDGPDADKKGWIVGIKKAIFNLDKIPVGTIVITQSENRYEFDGFREIYGFVKSENKPDIIAKVTMQLLRVGDQRP